MAQPNFIEWLAAVIEPYSDKMTRAQWIHYFAGEYVFPKFMNSGYQLTVSKEELRSKLATWIFTIDCEYAAAYSPILNVPAAKHKGQLRDWEDFLYVFSDARWSAVRRRLAHGETFFCESRATDYFYNNLTYFLYRFISIDKSPAIQLADCRERELDEEEKEFLISEGLWVEEKRGGRHEDEQYFREAGFFRGDRRYDI